MLALAACDARLHAALPDEPSVLVVVVAAVGEQSIGSPSRPAGASTDRRHPIEQIDKLGDVVAVGGGQRPGERQPAAIYEEMVLAAAPTPIDRAGTRFRAPYLSDRSRVNRAAPRGFVARGPCLTLVLDSGSAT